MAQGDRVLDPGCGAGSFCQAIKAEYPDCHLTAIDIAPEWIAQVEALGVADGVMQCDYLTVESGFFGDRFDLIIGNPPFSLAQKFVERSFELIKPHGKIVFLLRLGFLESKKRIPFWQTHPAAEVVVLSERPSFLGGPTDSAAYGVFTWDASAPGDHVTRLRVASWKG